ncbi:MAG TPA: hypothetical protein VF107_13350 [Burkholderiaceae bacterium]
MRSISMLVRCVGFAALALCGTLPAHAQAGDAARDAFRACDAQAFLALNIARNYLMSDRNRGLVMPQVEGSEIGRAMAEDLFDRVDRGQIRHPGQFAADTLFKCARELNLRVGASKEQAAVCFTRTDVPLLLHAERVKGTARQKALANVSGKLTQRTLYPMSLIQQVADAVYRPEKVPDVQQLMGAVAWGCINSGAPGAASAPGR